MLVAVHGQADQWRLRQGDQHREVLDGFGGEPRRDGRWRDYAELLRRAPPGARAERRPAARAGPRPGPRDRRAAGRARRRSRRLDPQPGEDVALRAEDERLAHADGLRASAAQAHALLSRRRRRMPRSRRRRRVRAAGRRARRAHRDDRATTRPCASSTAAWPSWATSPPTWRPTSRPTSPTSTSTPPGWPGCRSDGPSSARLTRKYGDTVDDVLAWAKESAARLDELEGADDRAEELRRELETLARRAGRARRRR